MTMTTKTFNDHTGKPSGELAVRFVYNRNNNCVELNLKGAILSDNAEEFWKFIVDIANYPGNLWRLNLEDLKILSTRGFRALVKLAKTVRKRGHRIEISGIDPIVFYLMRENRLDKHFNFMPDKKALLDKQRQLFSCSSLHFV